MHVIIDITVYCQNPQHVYSTMRKEFDSDAAIVPGMHLEDRAWKEERKITGVILNPDDNSLYLGLDVQIDNRPTKDACEQLVKAYRSVGWKSASE